MKGLLGTDAWRLCEELSIDQAADLIIGFPPGGFLELEARGTEFDFDEVVDYKNRLVAAQTALSHAVRSGKLPATVRKVQEQQWDGDSESTYLVETESIDSAETTMLVEDIREWLASRGISTGFFFGSSSQEPDYLNPDHPRYAPKLAATVRAWLGVGDLKGKHPKQALVKWLRENAANFGLSDDEGKPNEQGIEECAKVANWQQGGGAPKTRGSDHPPHGCWCSTG